MQRRVFLLVGLILALPMVAQANVISLTGGGNNVVLQPNTADQIITLEITGTDQYTDSNLFLQINNNVGPAPIVTGIFGDDAGAIPAGNFAGSVWAGGSAGVVLVGLSPGAGFVTAGSAPISSNGLYALLNVSTVGITGGEFPVTFIGTDLINGLDEEFEPIYAPLTTVPFTISVVPEPSSIVMGLFGAAGVAAVAIRRRRRSA